MGELARTNANTPLARGIIIKNLVGGISVVPIGLSQLVDLDIKLTTPIQTVKSSIPVLVTFNMPPLPGKRALVNSLSSSCNEIVAGLSGVGPLVFENDSEGRLAIACYFNATV